MTGDSLVEPILTPNQGPPTNPLLQRRYTLVVGALQASGTMESADKLGTASFLELAQQFMCVTDPELPLVDDPAVENRPLPGGCA